VGRDVDEPSGLTGGPERLPDGSAAPRSLASSLGSRNRSRPLDSLNGRALNSRELAGDGPRDVLPEAHDVALPSVLSRAYIAAIIALYLLS